MNKIILEGFRGSLSHGVYVKDYIDDVDIMRIVAVNPYDYWSLKKPFDNKEYKRGKFDIVIYSLKKFMRLLLKGNPNVINMLWLKPEHYRFIHKILGQPIIDNRDKLIGAKPVYDAFNGYAFSQFKRMTHFHKYTGYMGKKRKTLVDKFGYDVENACHLIRLLFVCRYYLKTGDIKVWFDGHDRNLLLDIKLGKYKLAEVKKMAEVLFNECRDLFIKCKLPMYPDYDVANDLLRHTMRFLYHINILTYNKDKIK